MTFHHLPALRAAAIAAVLAFSGLQAQAASYVFDGVTDSGALTGTAFSGAFSFNDQATDFDGSVALSSFSLSFVDQHWGMGQADATPTAVFSFGQFIGVEYAANGKLPSVSLSAGFSLGDAYLAYDTTGAGIEGFGTLNISAVPEPASWALMLGGLALAGAAARRQRRG